MAMASTLLTCTYLPQPQLTTHQTFSHTAKLSQHHSSTVTSRWRGRSQTNSTYMMTALCQIEHRHSRTARLITLYLHKHALFRWPADFHYLNAESGITFRSDSRTT